MNRKPRLLKILNICLMAAMILGGVMPATPPVARAQVQAGPLRGDITGDGVVDGQDALRIMRVVEGYETATPEEVERGDVYPLPGTGGRLVGDGQLTKEDAEKILRSAVGLIPEGEITGDYGESWPVVDHFEPLRGPAGTLITVYGQNFVAGSPGENIVYIGESLAPVLSSTGMLLKVTVPEGAISGRVRVITPAGEGSSSIDFSVMVERAGQLVPPTGFSPTDYTVANGVGDKSDPDADGAFSIPTDSYGVTIQMALPEDKNDERILLNMDMFGEQTLVAQAVQAAQAALAIADDPPVMDLLTTAQGMVFLSPYLASDDVAFAEATMAVIEDDPNVLALADLLAQLYEETEEPLDDERFDEAYIQAVESVLNRLPAGMFIDLGSPGGQSDDPAAAAPLAPPQDVLDAFGSRSAGDVQFFHLGSQVATETSTTDWQWQAWYPENDFKYTRAEAGMQPGKIKPAVDKGNPVDWIVQLAEVDDIYNVFPEGNQSLVKLDPRRVLPRGTYHSLSGAAADSTLQYINLFGMAFNATWDATGQAISGAAPDLQGSLTPVLHVDPNKDGVYVVRAYSGMLGDGANPDEFDFVYDELPNGRTAFLTALGQNAAWAAIDMISVGVDVRNSVDNATLKDSLQKGIQLAIARSPRALSTVAGAHLVLSVAHSVVKDVLSVLVADMVDEGIAKALVKIVGKSVNPVTLLYRVSTGAQGVERISSLIGLNRRMSPLETWIIVVGEPFVPRVERVEPDAAKPGEIVTLVGRNFDGRAAENNEVRLGAWWPPAKVAEVLEVSSDGTRLRLRIPADAPAGEASIWLKVRYRATPLMQSVTLKLPRVPHVRSIERDYGFAPYQHDNGPFANYRGTLVIMNTENMIALEGETKLDRAMFGGTVAEIDDLNSTPTKIVARVPQMSPGETEIYISSPEYGVESNRHSFTVLGAPRVTAISPAEGRSGELMTLAGYFGPVQKGRGEIEVEVKHRSSGRTVGAGIRSVSESKLVFDLPDLLEEDEDSAVLDVVVWTPGGPSSTLSVTERGDVEPDIDPDVPDTFSLPAGYLIPVMDLRAGSHPGNKVSLQEAADIGSGVVANPFLAPWDDKNQVFEWIFNEKRECHDENGQEVCTCYYDEEPDTENGPFYSYHVGDYDIEITQGNPGTEGATHLRRDNYNPECPEGKSGLSDPYYWGSENLDEPEEDEEVNCDAGGDKDDCPEEGDFITYLNGDQPGGGKDYSDQIEVGDLALPERTFAASSLTLDDTDTVEVLANDHLVVDGDVTLLDQGTIKGFASWQSGLISFVGNHNKIQGGAEGGGMQAGGIEIKGSSNIIDVGDLKLAGDVTIDSGDYNAIIVDSRTRRGGASGSAEMDGAIKMTYSARNTIRGETLEIGEGIEIEGQGDNGISSTSTTPCKIINAPGTGISLINTFGNHIDCDIENAGGVGVLFDKGGWNGVTGDIEKAGSGVLAKQGIHNSFRIRTASVAQLGVDPITILNGTGVDISLNARCSGEGGGVQIVGGKNNEAVGGITNCGGFTISGGVGNRVGGSYEGPSDPAVVLENTVRSWGGAEVIGGHGIGGVLRNVSYGGLSIRGCGMTTGVESSGAQQHHNRLGFSSAGCAAGPSEYGIKVDNGSHHNTISGNIHKAGRDGVTISGGAHDNVIEVSATANQRHGIYLGDAKNTDIRVVSALDNGQDGIHVSKQAVNTAVIITAGQRGYASGNGGNGITVLGAGTTIMNATIGDAQAPNQGYGIFVDGVPSITIKGILIAENCDGGLRIANVTQTLAPGQKAPVLVELVGIGARYDDSGGCGAVGGGVELFSTTDVRARNVEVSGYAHGIHVEGYPAARYDFENISVHDNGLNGLELVGLEDAEIVNVTSLENGAKGIAIDYGKNIVLGEQGAWILNEFNVDDNGEAGLYISRSQNVAAVYGRIERNGGAGVIVDDGSQDIVIFEPRIQDNQAEGILVRNSSGVRIAAGFNDNVISWIQDNAGAGVIIDNAQDVVFNRELPATWPRPFISGNEGPGILIKGAGTNGVAIAGWMIQGNESAGVQVEGGASNVLIGDFGEGYANLITGNAIGILAQGEDTDVIIANNRIWHQLPEAAGSGDRHHSGTSHSANPLEAMAEMAGVGVALQDGISNATISGNVIEDNATEGVWLGGADHTLLLNNTVQHNAEGVVVEDSPFDAARSNQIAGNDIRRNEGAGVVIHGGGAAGNTISRNTITNNGGKGISLEAGGNAQIPAPMIERIGHRGANISGQVDAPDGSVVEIFADEADEGALLLGTATVTNRQFALNAQVPRGMKLHATVTHPNGNTSEFGPAQSIDPPKGAVAFTSTRDSNQEIYLMGADLSSASRLTARPAADFSPRLCSGGTEIVFVSDAATVESAGAAGVSDIWSVMSDGTGLTQITQVGDALDPACTPQGDQVVYTAGGDIFIFPLEPDGGGGEEIGYDDGVVEVAYGQPPGDAYGVHFTRTPEGVPATEPLTAIKFWIHADVTEFQWQIYDWVEGRPGTVIAEGETTPETTGWYTVEITDVEVNEDFLVGIRYFENDRPKLGFDCCGGVPSERSWVDSGSGWWKVHTSDFFMIRAVFGDAETPLVQDDANNRQPDWCSDGSKIAFTSDRSGNDDIWVIDADGGNPRQLTADPAPDHSPVFSPDCSRIAFVSERDGNPEIYLIDAGGTNPGRLSSHPAADTDPAWLPDGLELLFVSDRDAGKEIYSMDTSGGSLTRLTNSLGDNMQPDAGASTAAQTQMMNLLAAQGQEGADVQIAIPRQRVFPGATITVPVTIVNADQLGLLAFDLAYDATEFSLQSITPGAALATGISAINPELYPSDTGLLRLAWVDAAGFSGDGVLAYLTFAVHNYVFGDSDLAFAAGAAKRTDYTAPAVIWQDGVIDVGHKLWLPVMKHR